MDETDVATNADAAAVTEVAVKTKRRANSSYTSPRPVHESVNDLDHAIAELTIARGELAAVEHTRKGSFARDQALLDPLSRVDLVRRFLVQTLKRHRRDA